MMKRRLALACVTAAVGGLAAPVVTLGAAKTVPNVTNLSLPKAERKLAADGIGYKTKGGGLFGIVLKGDWGVCAQIPSAGSPVKGKVELVVGHYTCGA